MGFFRNYRYIDNHIRWFKTRKNFNSFELFLKFFNHCYQTLFGLPNKAINLPHLFTRVFFSFCSFSQSRARFVDSVFSFVWFLLVFGVVNFTSFFVVLFADTKLDEREIEIVKDGDGERTEGKERSHLLRLAFLLSNFSSALQL